MGQVGLVLGISLPKVIQQFKSYQGWNKIKYTVIITKIYYL